MQTLKSNTTFIYGLSHNNIFIMMYMTFILIGKMLLTRKLTKNAKEVVLPMQGERKAFTLLCFFLKNLQLFLLDHPGR